MRFPRTPVHHQLLGCHARWHPLLPLDLFLLDLVRVVLFNESVTYQRRGLKAHTDMEIPTLYPA